MRRSASQPPRSSPCWVIAEMAYWEHEGVNRQLGGRRGEIPTWYPRMSAMQASWGKRKTALIGQPATAWRHSSRSARSAANDAA